MDRRDQIEGFVIGTLLNDFDGENYHSCEAIVIPGMFRNKKLGEIYRIISDMHSKGQKVTTPYYLCEFCKWSLSKEILNTVITLATNFDFLSMKAIYNMNIHLFDNNHRKRYTNVTFNDYINQFIKLAYESQPPTS